MKNDLGIECCACGKVHTAAIDEVIVGSGVLARVPELVRRYGAEKPFVLADENTFRAAGEQVCGILQEHGIEHVRCVLAGADLEPNEQTAGAAFLHFDASCDLIIAVGSGVLNDIGKLLSHVSGRKYFIVATAPSMDGYASASSSMNRDGLKVSLATRCADVIIGDLDILKNAPERMLKAGLGDMLAKYVSIAEWRIAHVITGEYYCPWVAQMIRDAVKKCVDHAQGLLKREESAVRAVFEGLIIGGVAMAYAGVSRPASGVEHYFSHVWDMRGLEFGTPVELHGIQCALATLQAAKLYEKLETMTPDEEKAKAYVAAFDYEAWSEQLRAFLGASGDTMIRQEQKEGKYDKSTHAARFRVIADHWEEIVRIAREEIPSSRFLSELLNGMGISGELSELGIDRETAKQTFRATKDIRDKYVLSRLAWDLGVLEELCEQM